MPRVGLSPVGKWQIVKERSKTRTFREPGDGKKFLWHFPIVGEVKAKGHGSAGWRKNATAAETEKGRRIRQPEIALARKSLETKILRKSLGERTVARALPGTGMGTARALLLSLVDQRVLIGEPLRLKEERATRS